MTLYTESKRAWREFDRAQPGEPDPDFYDHHCGGCDGPLEDDGACLACMTPAELAERAARLLAVTRAHHEAVQAVAAKHRRDAA